MFTTHVLYLALALGAYGQSNSGISSLAGKLNSTSLSSSIGKTNSSFASIGRSSANSDDASILKSLEMDDTESTSFSSSTGSSLSSSTAQSSSGSLPSASQLADEYMIKLSTQFKKKLDETFNTFTFTTSDTFKLTKEEARDLFVNDLPDEVIPGFRPRAFEAFDKLVKASAERSDLADGLARRIQGHLRDQWTEYSKPRIAKWMKDHPDFVEQIQAVPKASTSTLTKTFKDDDDEDGDLDLNLRKRHYGNPAAVTLAIISLVIVSLWLIVNTVFLGIWIHRVRMARKLSASSQHQDEALQKSAQKNQQRQNMVPNQPGNPSSVHVKPIRVPI